MKKYLLWKQIQQRLTEHFHRTGEAYSFFEATKELWQEGQYISAPEIPAVSFEEWDIFNLDELEGLLDVVPVDLEPFYLKFQKKQTVLHATKYMIEFDGTPIRIAANQRTGIHTHDAFEVYYMIRGEGRMILDTGEHILPENSACIVSPGFRHNAVADEGCLLVSIVLAEQTVENTLYKLLMEESILTEFFHSALTERRGYLMFSHFRTRQVLTYLQGILHESFGGEAYSKTICSNCIENLLACLLRHGNVVERHSQEQGRHGTKNMLEILKHIQANYRTTSLQETAVLFHYEPSYLGKQIKAYTGKNYSVLINELRIETAKRLITNTDYSVEEVGQLAGFDTAGNFTRSFKKAVGVAPGIYRKGEKNNR